MGTIILKSLMAFGTKLLMSFASEKLIEWAFFYVADQIVKSTKTDHDDKFLEEVKKAYNTENNQ
jgi:hypothetical protein